jgi:hypothetical protein
VLFPHCSRKARHGPPSLTREFVASALALTATMIGCDKGPGTTVTIENHYATSARGPLVVYRAKWEAVAFPDPVPPGSSSAPESTVPASKSTAYVVLAPGWDPASASPPTSLIVMQSRDGFEVHLDGALHVPVDDTTFIGNCAAGSFLSTAQADFITRLVFPADFASVRYEPATCTAKPIADAGDAGAD